MTKRYIEQLMLENTRNYFCLRHIFEQTITDRIISVETTTFVVSSIIKNFYNLSVLK